MPLRFMPMPFTWGSIDELLAAEDVEGETVLFC